MSSAALAFFLNSRSDEVMLEMIDITHSEFTQPYYQVRNATDGVTVTLETAEERDYNYYPLRIVSLGDEADLDTGIRIDFGDLGEVLPRELDAITIADAMNEKPQVTYRAYRSSDLSAPLIGPLHLEVQTFSFSREGASFEASAPYINLNKTGETYNLTRFFTLRGFTK